MSDDTDDEQPNASTDVVGYKRPPIRHRFQKGQTGNPHGRPPKNAAPAAAQNFPDLVRDELGRPLDIHEGGKPIIITTIGANLRSGALRGVKGDQKAIAENIRLAREDHRARQAQQKAAMKTGFDHQEYARPLFARKRGPDERAPDVIPHPDDMKFNESTGTFEVNGPFNAAQKETWDRMRERRAAAQLAIAQHRKRLKRSPRYAEILREDIAHEERVIAAIDRLYPDEATRRHPAFDRSAWIKAHARR